MTFVILYADPDPVFQPKAEAHMVYAYLIPLFFPLRYQSCMPFRLAKETHYFANAMSKWFFLSKRRLDNI